MSKDFSLNPISNSSYEEYKNAVLSNIDRNLVPFVQESWLAAIYNDTDRKRYPIRTTFNEIETQAGLRKRNEQAKEYTGWLLPGSDIVKVRGGNTSVIGWRPNLLTAVDGKPQVISLTVWGEYTSLWVDRETMAKDRRKVSLPLYRRVTLVAEERDYEDKTGVKRSGFTMLCLKKIHDTKPVEISVLMELLRKSVNCVSLNQLGNRHLYQTVVIKGIRWRHAEGIDYWIDSATAMDKVAIIDPSTGQQKILPNPISSKPEPQWESRPKRVKSEFGQPFIQERIGSGEEGIPIETTPTFKISVSGVGEGSDDSGLRPTIEFQNYRHGQPHLFIFGFDDIIQDAAKLGNMGDADPNRNPFSQLNRAYRGTELLAVVNFTKMTEYTGQTGTFTYMIFIPGVVFYHDAPSLAAGDLLLPPMPPEYTAELLQEMNAGVLPTQSTVVQTAPVPKVEVVQPPTERPVVSQPTTEGSQAPLPTTSVVGAPEGEEEEDREDQLLGMKVEALKKLLKMRAVEGYEVNLKPRKKLPLVQQLIAIETGQVMPAKKIMEAHAVVEQAEAIKAEETPKDDNLASARSKLLAKQQSQLDATKELEQSGPATTEPDEREMELIRTLYDVGIKDLFPDEDFDGLWGEKAPNELSIFSDWVTPDHRDWINTIITKIRAGEIPRPPDEE